jgi:hypothetical protein
MKTADELVRQICSEVLGSIFPYDSEKDVAPRLVDDQMYELSLLALRLQRIQLEVRQRGCTAEALRQTLYEVIR